MTNDADFLRKEIAKIEEQLLFLRRRLDGDPTALPVNSFSALRVAIAGRSYLISTTPVVEVLMVPWCDPLPQAPAWVLGTFRYDDAMVPLVDLAMRMDLGQKPLDSSQFAVITHHGNVADGTTTAFLVDAIEDVLQVHPKNLAEPSRDISYAPFLLGALTDSSGSGALHLLATERLAKEFILHGDD